MQQKAAYLHLTDPAAAQAVLASAVQQNRYVLRPVAGINPARPVAAQAQAAQKRQPRKRVPEDPRLQRPSWPPRYRAPQRAKMPVTGHQ
jgi:hypothetical protein